MPQEQEAKQLEDICGSFNPKVPDADDDDEQEDDDEEPSQKKACCCFSIFFKT